MMAVGWKTAVWRGLVKVEWSFMRNGGSRNKHFRNVGWTSRVVFWPFVASFPFILAFCGFISFHFGLLCLPQNVGVYGWGYRGLRGGYAALTRGELVASDKRNSQLQGHQIPQKSHSLIFEIMIWENSLTQVCLRDDLSSKDTQSAYAAYATMRIFRYCAYVLFL